MNQLTSVQAAFLKKGFVDKSPAVIAVLENNLLACLDADDFDNYYKSNNAVNTFLNENIATIIRYTYQFPKDDNIEKERINKNAVRYIKKNEKVQNLIVSSPDLLKLLFTIAPSSDTQKLCSMDVSVLTWYDLAKTFLAYDTEAIFKHVVHKQVLPSLITQLNKVVGIDEILFKLMGLHMFDDTVYQQDQDGAIEKSNGPVINSPYEKFLYENLNSIHDLTGKQVREAQLYEHLLANGENSIDFITELADLSSHIMDIIAAKNADKQMNSNEVLPFVSDLLQVAFPNSSNAASIFNFNNYITMIENPILQYEWANMIAALLVATSKMKQIPPHVTLFITSVARSTETMKEWLYKNTSVTLVFMKIVLTLVRLYSVTKDNTLWNSIHTLVKFVFDYAISNVYLSLVHSKALDLLHELMQCKHNSKTVYTTSVLDSGLLNQVIAIVVNVENYQQPQVKRNNFFPFACSIVERVIVKAEELKIKLKQLECWDTLNETLLYKDTLKKKVKKARNKHEDLVEQAAQDRKNNTVAPSFYEFYCSIHFAK